MLKLNTLGGLTLSIDEQPIGGFVSRKAEALLVYLAMNPREHPRETLADLLWDDLSQSLALSYLRTVLSSLQKQLAPYLKVSRHSISLNTDIPYWLDFTELNRILEQAQEEWETSERFTHLTLRQLEQALKLYKGPFLHGFHVRNCREFENWMLLEQEQMRNRVLDTCYCLGKHYLQQRLFNDGMIYTAQALQIDPIWEEAHRQMMLLLAYSGQKTAALAQFETCTKMLRDELSVEPEAETISLRDAIRSGKIERLNEESPASTLPIVATTFVDRPAEVQQIMKQLNQRGCRLLTLIGPGGIGKTRLALEIARQLLSDYRDGVYFISFSDMHDPDNIVTTLANGINFSGDFSGEENVIQYLHNKQMLLILDNFETVIASAELISRILEKTNSLKILITSRERLNLAEEWLCPVETLAIPESEDTPDAALYPSVQLFAQSAARVQPTFSIDRELTWIIQICRAVDGMPLAIELAASWMRMMSCKQIAHEVQQGLNLLTTTLRNVPERHRSMHSVFESSWKMLSLAEQRIFRELSVFRGGFDREAAYHVTGASLLDLSSLVDKSLLRSIDWRYDIHELLRHYAREQLDSLPEEKARVLAAHNAYFAGFLEDHQDKLSRDLPDSQFMPVMMELENIHLAWKYALENAANINGYLRPLFQLYDAQNNYKDAEAMFSAAVEKLKHDEFGLARAQVFQGACNFRMDRYETAEKLIQCALPVLQQYKAERELNYSLLMLARSAAARGRYRDARQYLTQVAQMLETKGAIVELANVLFRLASGATMLGEYALAQQYLQEGLQALGKEQHKTPLMNYLIAQGDLNVRLGRFEEAQSNFEHALALSKLVESKNNHAMILADLAQAVIMIGDYRRAEALCQESIQRNQELHNRWGEAYAFLHLGRTYLAVNAIPEAQHCFEQGIKVCEENGIQTTLVALLHQQAKVRFQGGRCEQALDDLRRALRISAAHELVPLSLDVLLTFGQLFESNDIASCVYHHPATTAETRALAKQFGNGTYSGSSIALENLIEDCLQKT